MIVDSALEVDHLAVEECYIAFEDLNPCCVTINRDVQVVLELFEQVVDFFFGVDLILGVVICQLGDEIVNLGHECSPDCFGLFFGIRLCRHEVGSTLCLHVGEFGFQIGNLCCLLRESRLHLVDRAFDCADLSRQVSNGSSQVGDGRGVGGHLSAEFADSRLERCNRCLELLRLCVQIGDSNCVSFNDRLEVGDGSGVCGSLGICIDCLLESFGSLFAHGCDLSLEGFDSFLVLLNVLSVGLNLTHCFSDGVGVLLNVLSVQTNLCAILCKCFLNGSDIALELVDGLLVGIGQSLSRRCDADSVVGDVEGILSVRLSCFSEFLCLLCRQSSSFGKFLCVGSCLGGRGCQFGCCVGNRCCSSGGGLSLLCSQLCLVGCCVGRSCQFHSALCLCFGSSKACFQCMDGLPQRGEIAVALLDGINLLLKSIQLLDCVCNLLLSR